MPNSNVNVKKRRVKRGKERERKHKEKQIDHNHLGSTQTIIVKPVSVDITRSRPSSIKAKRCPFEENPHTVEEDDISIVNTKRITETVTNDHETKDTKSKL